MDAEIQTMARELIDLTRRDGLAQDQQRRRRQLLEQLVAKLRFKPGGGEPSRGRWLERRRFLRVPSPLVVRFRVGDATIAAEAAEMSLGGLSLRDHLWAIPDQRMRIDRLEVGGRHYPLRVDCRVAWRVSADSRLRAGLEFVELSDDARRQLRQIFEAIFVAYLQRLLEAGQEAPEDLFEED
jgi:plasmid stabilization system protein ParE